MVFHKATHSVPSSLVSHCMLCFPTPQRLNNSSQTTNPNWKTHLIHHRSAFFILTVFGFFCFRTLIFTDFIQSPIIFFGNVTSQIQDWLQIFQVWRPRFSVVILNEKMCSSPPESGLLFFLCTKSNLFTFSICNIQLPSGYGSNSLMQSLMLECVAMF
jgi:hypothetical protein